MGTRNQRIAQALLSQSSGEKGETISGVEIYAKKLFDYLIKIQKNPDNYAKQELVIKSLRSQGSLAALRIDDEDIRPCALNTLKKSAMLALDGGFTELDALRISVAEAIERTLDKEANPRETKEGYKRRLSDAERQIKELQEDLWQVSRAFYKAMSNARIYAKDSQRADLIERCIEDERELRCMVSLSRNKAIAEVQG